jgi:hypothetical protein
LPALYGVQTDRKEASKMPDTIKLRGKTLRGKNRLNRGGTDWLVVRRTESKLFVQSLAVGQREMFWIDLPVDQHVEVI